MVNLYIFLVALAVFFRSYITLLLFCIRKRLSVIFLDKSFAVWDVITQSRSFGNVNERPIIKTSLWCNGYFEYLRNLVFFFGNRRDWKGYWTFFSFTKVDLYLSCLYVSIYFLWKVNWFFDDLVVLGGNWSSEFFASFQIFYLVFWWDRLKMSTEFELIAFFGKDGAHKGLLNRLCTRIFNFRHQSSKHL